MGKEKTIHSFFKRKESDEEGSSKRHKTSTSEAETHETQQVNLGNVEGPLPQANTNEVDTKEEDSSNFERDPGKRKQLWEYPPNLREQVRRFYLGEGPYQIILNEYPKDDSKKNPRKFQPSWFRVFPNWLEYSPTTDACYCFLCYIFCDKPNDSHGHDSFIVKGFKNWKKVRGKDCAFLKHISTTQHRSALIFKENLLNQAAHIENVISKQNEELIMKNRLRLKTTIDVIRWLTFQACALRGHDESSTSKNRGNFLEMLQLLASYNDEVANVILGNAPYNSKYTSSDIQKEILNIIANRVRKSIRSEVGDSYYCVMVDESRDESKKEQMAIVLRFVDEKGIIRERFLGLVHVRDTLSATLKLSLWQQLSHNQFDVNKIRGQGYDGASNMRGEWNGLQALVLKDSPYAYYIHCFAHRLQLALVCASKEVLPVHKFFSDLVGIINVVCASSKRHDELQKAKQDEIKELLELGEIKSGKGKNQVGTLKRPGDTRWGSHFDSICSLLKMYNVTLTVLKRIMDDPSSKYTQRGDAYAVYGNLKSFEFVFILHLMKEIMGKTDTLSQALQKKSQDILNAMDQVATTKVSLDTFRNTGWDKFLEDVTFFCEKHQVTVPDMDSPYVSTNYRPRKNDLHVTFGHYYRADLFISTLDKQLHELNSRFSEHTMELLSLSASLASKEINVEDICLLVERYYPEDFTEQERIGLQYQLENLNIEMKNNIRLSGVSNLPDLCKTLVETQKRETYNLVDRVCRLILTLPVSTATTERAFSAMKIFKTRLRNKMSDEYLADSLVIYIEKEIAENFDSNSIIDEFKDLKGRRAEL
ncbi:hypothetical protein SSX86_001612 [Deinandra increscens subsp. villosa]|uniref:TTF-type domain-containing protein n=1 Tax=Deinandra increscens subsp. villosa TaxID=3103831 RepID=A0AAP0DWI4_9ASTR